MSLPGAPIPTEAILGAVEDRISMDLGNSVRNMGIDTRHSVIADYPGYVSGRSGRSFDITATQLAADAVAACLDNWGGDPDQIGLVVAITNTADRPLPCLGYELVALFRGRLADDVSVLNLQNMGCSSLVKAVEIAGMFIASRPDKTALIVSVEALTGLVETLKAERYRSFREILASRSEGMMADDMRNMQRFLFAMLFGDAAVSFVLGRSQGAGRLGFGHIVHATNLQAEDAEILRMNEGGIQVPVPDGFPLYVMGDEVPRRGSDYVTTLLSQIMGRYGGKLSNSQPSDIFQFFHIHTGSKKILSRIFTQLNFDRDSPQAEASFGVLSRYANTSCCSVGLMLAERCQAPVQDEVGLVISFGVGFSASAAVVGTNKSGELWQ